MEVILYPICASVTVMLVSWCIELFNSNKDNVCTTWFGVKFPNNLFFWASQVLYKSDIIKAVVTLQNTTSISENSNIPFLRQCYHTLYICVCVSDHSLIT